MERLIIIKQQVERKFRSTCFLRFFYAGIDLKRLALLFCFVQSELCASAFPVPKGDQHIALAHNIHIADKRSAPAVLLIVGQKLDKPQAVPAGIVGGTAVDPARAARNDTVCPVRQIRAEIGDLEVPRTYNGDFDNKSPFISGLSYDIPSCPF